MNRHTKLSFLVVALPLATLVWLPSGARSVEIDLAPPGEREFIRDLADMIKPEDEQKIKQIADKLLTDKATPLIVVTIEDMARHGGGQWPIEFFSMKLFNQWRIGHARLGGQSWNTGILFLISKGDRKARIELGAHWERGQDALCQQILDEQVIPLFKQEDFSAGILAGVVALDAMAHGLPQPPRQPSPPSLGSYLLLFAILSVAVFTIVSLLRRGSSGWAWLMWGGLFAFVGWLLWRLLQDREDDSGFGFPDGSFGDGSSGGGGATGSW